MGFTKLWCNFPALDRNRMTESPTCERYINVTDGIKMCSYFYIPLWTFCITFWECINLIHHKLNEVQVISKFTPSLSCQPVMFKNVCVVRLLGVTTSKILSQFHFFLQYKNNITTAATEALLTIWNNLKMPLTLLILSALMKMLFNIPLELNLQLSWKSQPQTFQILPYERTKQLNVSAVSHWKFYSL